MVSPVSVLRFGAYILETGSKDNILDTGGHSPTEGNTNNNYIETDQNHRVRNNLDKCEQALDKEISHVILEPSILTGENISFTN